LIIGLSDGKSSGLWCDDHFSEDAKESSRLRPEDPEPRTGRRPQNQSHSPASVKEKKQQDRCVIS
jgi:hypothetical protein